MSETTLYVAGILLIPFVLLVLLVTSIVLTVRSGRGFNLSLSGLGVSIAFVSDKENSIKDEPHEKLC